MSCPFCFSAFCVPGEHGEPIVPRPREANATSISFRLRRIICEDAYVTVLVTDMVMNKDDGSLDVGKLTAAAIRLGDDPRVEWQREETDVSLHPTQEPLPGYRTSYKGKR